MATVYIIYSKSIDAYYIGSCLDLQLRLQQHNSHQFSVAFTQRADDWEIFFSISELSYDQARKIEKHIKRMKSRKYVENLKKHPAISARLLKKYR